jgi:hypothetical protein
VLGLCHRCPTPLCRAGSPVLTHDTVPWLFVGRLGRGSTNLDTLWSALELMVGRAVEQNADLDELVAKRIAWHPLRASFATLLFSNGCDIRSVNERMLHMSLSVMASLRPFRSRTSVRSISPPIHEHKHDHAGRHRPLHPAGSGRRLVGRHGCAVPPSARCPGDLPAQSWVPTLCRCRASRSRCLHGHLSEEGRARATRVQIANTILTFFRSLQDAGRLVSCPARMLPVPEDGGCALPQPPLTGAEVMAIMDGLPCAGVVEARAATNGSP